MSPAQPFRHYLAIGTLLTAALTGCTEQKVAETRVWPEEVKPGAKIYIGLSTDVLRDSLEEHAITVSNRHGPEHRATSLEVVKVDGDWLYVKTATWVGIIQRQYVVSLSIAE